MTWGQGYGLPWGEDPLIEVAEPVSVVGSPPTTFYFVDEQDGPLPGGWETYILDTDAGGDVSVTPDDDPHLRHRVRGGLGIWDYSRSPVIPGLGEPYQERGVAAGPSGVLVGRNANLAAVLVSPTRLLGDKDDEFIYEVTLGLRFSASPYRFVGGRVRARWMGSWVEPMTLDAVGADGQDAVAIATTEFDQLPDAVDRWRANPNTELSVTVRGDKMTILLNGVWQTYATVPADGPAKPVIVMRIYSRKGVFISAHPALVAVQARSLRDLDRLGPPPQLPGDVLMESPVLPTLQLPLQDLLDRGLLKRIGSRRFQAVQEFLADVGGLSNGGKRILVREGEVMHARERFEGQALVPVTRDLAFQRGRGGM